MDYKLILINLVHRSYNGQISSMPQLGLLYIASYAKQKLIDCKILHTDTPLSDLSNILNPQDNFLVGFYCNSDNIDKVLKTCRKLKANFQNNCKTILGGPVATIRYDHLIKDPSVDFICRNDGEELTTELVIALNQKEADLSTIRGLSYKELGKVKHNEAREFRKNLDHYPMPDRDSYPSISNKEKISLITSRGCGFKCSFCFESSQGIIRYHSPERVIEEIRTIKNLYEAKYITFSDDALTTNPTRLREICALIKNNFKPHDEILWYCEARVDTLFKNQDLIELMKKSGLARIQIGTESGCQKVIDAYNKNITIEQILFSVKKLNDVGVQSIFTNFILGGPHDSPETFQKTIDLMKELHKLAPGRFECACNFLSPYPGTDIYNNPDKYELTISDSEFFTDLSGNYVCTSTKNSSKEDLLDKYREFENVHTQQMRNYASNIPFELIREHLLNTLHGLKTQWANLFLVDEIHASWLQLIKTQKYHFSLDELTDTETITPQRTLQLTRIINGVLAWPMMRREIVFSSYELLLIELFSGKLTFGEIATKINENSPYKITKEKILSDIVNYAKQLAEINLLVFKKEEYL